MKNVFEDVLNSVEIGYKKGFIDGFNHNLPFEDEEDENDLKDILEPAIKKARRKFEKGLLKIEK